MPGSPGTLSLTCPEHRTLTHVPSIPKAQTDGKRPASGRVGGKETPQWHLRLLYRQPRWLSNASYIAFWCDLASPQVCAEEGAEESPGEVPPVHQAAGKAAAGRLLPLCGFSVENWKCRNIATIIKPNRRHPLLPQNTDTQAWLTPKVSSLPVHWLLWDHVGS